jgi:acyl-coenzyme A synthetase/AMP-(fatty) acid ligase
MENSGCVNLYEMIVKSNENLRRLLENRAAVKADKTFLFSESDARRWTYAEFDRTVNRTANMLAENKIQKGDVVSF